MPRSLRVGRAGELRQPAADVDADLLAQVAADDVGAVADAVRIRRRTFELSRMRVESTQLAPTTTTLPSTSRSAPVLRSKYWTPLARPLSSTRIARRDGVGADLQLAGLQRERQQVIGGAEERRRVAAGAAAAAVVAGGEAARRPRHVGAAAGDDVDADALGGFLHASARRSAAPAAGWRNLLPGSESESSVPPQTPISCSTLS